MVDFGLYSGKLWNFRFLRWLNNNQSFWTVHEIGDRRTAWSASWCDIGAISFVSYWSLFGAIRVFNPVLEPIGSGAWIPAWNINSPISCRIKAIQILVILWEIYSFFIKMYWRMLQIGECLSIYTLIIKPGTERNTDLASFPVYLNLKQQIIYFYLWLG